MESGRLLLLLPWRAADHTLRAGRKVGGVRVPAPMPATTARRCSGETTEEHATLESSQSIHLRRWTAGEGARRCVCGDEVVQPSKGGTNGGGGPGIGKPPGFDFGGGDRRDL